MNILSECGLTMPLTVRKCLLLMTLLFLIVTFIICKVMHIHCTDMILNTAYENTLILPELLQVLKNTFINLSE